MIIFPYNHLMTNLINKFKNRTEKLKYWRNNLNKHKKLFLKLIHVVPRVRKKSQ